MEVSIPSRVRCTANRNIPTTGSAGAHASCNLAGKSSQHSTATPISSKMKGRDR